MKIQNFIRFDEKFKGHGLRAGGALEKIIWEKYQNQTKLKQTFAFRAVSFLTNCLTISYWHFFCNSF